MKRLLATLIAAGCAGAAHAGLITFDEDGITHGTQIDNQYAGLGVTVSVDNVGGGPDIGVAYDSAGDHPEDPDLEQPWDGGNLPADTDLGHVLIIQEHAGDPDDEGSRPAGYIWFDFDFLIDSIGFDLVDIEGVNEEPGHVATFYGGGAALATVRFEDFLDGGAHDRDAVYGNNTANRIAPLTAAALGIGAFDRVEFYLGGSGAIDNITWTEVPEPASAALLGLALLALACRARSGARGLAHARRTPR